MESDQDEWIAQIIDTLTRDVEIKKSEQCGELEYGYTAWMIPERGTVEVECSGVVIGEANYTANENGKIRVHLNHIPISG